MLWTIKWLALCCVLLGDSSQQEDDVGRRYDEKVWYLVQQWAPRVWLAPGERFLPSTVSEFIPKVTPTKVNCTDCFFPATSVLSGTESLDYYLIPNQDLGSLLNNTQSFLYGTHPLTGDRSVTIYAFVSSCDPEYSHFFVTYWFFFPYNEGKEICSLRLGKSKAVPMLNIFKKCLGKVVRFGNHVGDWEHMTLQVKDWVPSGMFLSVHSVGVHYMYDNTSNIFVVSSSTAKGLSRVGSPPLTVQVVDGHPVLFAAKGSHGLWGSAGVHKYTRIQLNQLVDQTGYGTPWDTWRDIHIYPEQGVGTPDWYNYRGKWGPPKSECLSLPKVGQTNICQFSDGPDSLSQREKEFSCTTKRTFRFW